MSIVRVQVSLVVCALLSSIAGTALAQVPPAPPPGGAPAAPDSAGPPPLAPPTAAAPPPTAPAAPPVAGNAGAGKDIIEIGDPAAMAGCRDLGEQAIDTARPGARGRLGIRVALKVIAQALGASHIHYSGYVVLADSNAQREHGHFYDCTSPALPAAAPSPAAAEAASPAAAEAAPAPRSSAIRTLYGGQLELVPLGSLRVKPPGDQVLEADTVLAYGVSGQFEYIVTPGIAIGVNPGVVMGLKTDGATASATQYDLRARARIGKLDGDGLGAHVYASAGASWLVMPNEAPTSMGLVVGFGAGVSHSIEHRAFVTLELGYQFGFQKATVQDVAIDVASRLFHIGLGIGAYL